MGTNYYHRTNICECCGRYDSQHICKSHVSFQAVYHYDTDGSGPVFIVASWVDWKARLDAGEVWNEYGEQIPTEKFVAEVEATRLEDRRRQFEWCVAHPNPWRPVDELEVGGDWLDGDGFSFHGGEFS